MAVVTPPSITPVPTPVPQRNDRVTFSDRVDAFVTWLINAVTEFGNVATNVAANATDAHTSALSASASASIAASSASANVWVSGTTYAVGASVWSPLNYLIYRRIIAGAGTTDPSLDSTNWASLGYQEKLVSGSNIKSINTVSLLGSGDITISANPIWVTKTSNYTAVSGDAIRANTSGGTFTITLPVSPSDNDTIRWKDYSGTFGTNKLTFGRNGKNIMGLAQDMDVSTSNFNGTLTFISATNDWRF